MSANPIDVSEFEESKTDQDKILNDGAWVPCRICWEMFLRLTLTARYCNDCKRAFCESEHGSFTGRGGGICVRCFNKVKMQLRRTKPN
jgi:hypothetical protein